ncbi:MAG: hypothetical protein MZU84_04645 [Sphingobacterium sp.]|nr:hypothetical protein [Sphingobacterium sp.]
MGRTIRRDWAPASPCVVATALASLLWLLPGGATPALAQSDPTEPAPNSPARTGARLAVLAPGAPSSRVRPLGAVARVLLEDGPAQSPTVARLLEAVGQSDLIVCVATGFLHVPGRLDFACAKQGVEYLRITVNVPELEPNLIAAFAHELQHAVEIAAAPEVTDAASLARHYRERGQCIYGDEYCTREAQRVSKAVLCEIGRCGEGEQVEAPACSPLASRPRPRLPPLASRLP